MKTVILAAGRGQRLRPFTEKYPKPLTPILGKPILEHTLALIRNVGIEDCIIVTGYLGNFIKKRLGDGSRYNIKLHYCHNPYYTLGNAVSLKAAEKMLKDEEPFLLLMADHYVSQGILEKALESVNKEPLLCVDERPRYPPQLKDATRVLVNSGGYIIDIGKKIPLWNAVDTGVFLLDNTIFKVIDALEKTASLLTITNCIKHLTLYKKPVWACDVSGRLWFDVDTQEDWAFVESFLCEALKCQERGTG